MCCINGSFAKIYEKKGNPRRWIFNTRPFTRHYFYEDRFFQSRMFAHRAEWRCPLTPELHQSTKSNMADPGLSQQCHIATRNSIADEQNINRLPKC